VLHTDNMLNAHPMALASSRVDHYQRPPIRIGKGLKACQGYSRRICRTETIPILSLSDLSGVQTSFKASELCKTI